MHLMFLSCFKATELIEKKLYFGLSFREKIQLSAHKAMCNACTNYEKQSFFMDKALSHPFNPADQSIDLTLLKEQTLSKIEKSK